MRLFGKRIKEKEKDEVLLGEPLKVRLPEDPVPQVAGDPALPAEVIGGGMEPAVPAGGHDALLRENEALKREIADLKSRIAFARAVLLADVEVPEAYRVAPHLSMQEPARTGMEAMAVAAGMPMGGAAPQPQSLQMGPVAGPQADMGMSGTMGEAPQPQPADDIRAMLAELKRDIAGIQQGVARPAMGGMAGMMATPAPAAPQPQPADDIRAMLAELKRDIAGIQQGVARPAMGGMAGMMATPAPAAPQPQPADDIRAMLAELKQDIEAIRRETPQPTTAPVVQPPAEDLRAMLAELKQDIAAIRRDEPVVQRRQDDDLREMLARLKEDIDSLKKEKAEPASSPAGSGSAMPENGVHRLLEELQQGVAELSGGGHGDHEERERSQAAAAPVDFLSDLPERKGRAPLFGGGRTAVKAAGDDTARPRNDESATDSEATSAASAAKGEDEISARIESLLAELHNELRQASGREFLKEEGGTASGSAPSEDDRDDEEPRRAALH